MRVRLLSIPPRQTGEDDQYAAPVESRGGARRFRPGEHDRTGKDRHRAQENAAIDILPKHNPGDRYRGEAFDIEQESARRRGRERQPAHEQGGAKNPAEQHNCAKPREVASPQRRLGAPQTKRTAPCCDQCEAGTRAEIKQPGKQQRIGDAEEQLCNRGARTKQECRA